MGKQKMPEKIKEALMLTDKCEKTTTEAQQRAVTAAEGLRSLVEKHAADELISEANEASSKVEPAKDLLEKAKAAVEEILPKAIIAELQGTMDDTWKGAVTS